MKFDPDDELTTYAMHVPDDERRIVQICASSPLGMDDEALYALDDSGRVWRFDWDKDGWWMMPRLPQGDDE